MVAVGAIFGTAPLFVGFTGDARTVSLVLGIFGMLLGLLYLGSPAWRMVVVVDDRGLEVLSGSDRRFALSWDEIVRVVASRTTKTCFVDGGTASRSFKVPGRGAPAPYDIEHKAALFDLIVSRVAAERIVDVTYVDQGSPHADVDQGSPQS